MNFTNTTLLSRSVSANCPVEPLAWTDDYLREKSLLNLLAITLNIASFPFTILMNVLVIVVVKRRRELQTNCNIVLANLAVTDLLVGTTVQPGFAALGIFELKGLSLHDFCRYFVAFTRFSFIPFAASLFQLALLSTERYVAMKFPLRYLTIVTTARIKLVVICSWLIPILRGVTSLLSNFQILNSIVNKTYFAVRVLTLIAIVYCHISVYVVTRRHEKQIQAEQVSPEATAKFLKEKKASRTTTIIIGVLIMCYTPLVLNGVVNRFAPREHFVRVTSTLIGPILISVSLLNSLCNPLIYCYRSKNFRGAIISCLKEMIHLK